MPAKTTKKKKTANKSGEEKFPLSGFHFRVDFLFSKKNEKSFLGPVEASFQEVSGLKGTMDIEIYPELGFNAQPKGLPTGEIYENLVLKRGVITDNKLFQWFEDALQYKQTLHVPVLITALNTQGANKGQPALRWLAYDAFPISYEIGGFDAMSSQLLVETLELRYAYFVRFK